MMGAFLRTLRSILPRRFVGAFRRNRYRSVVSCRREDQAAIARLVRRGHPVVELKGPRATWLHLECPCRCGSILRINLMTTAEPVWRLSTDDRDRASVSPSLDVPACGSHFWIVRGGVSWVREGAR